jgi:arsenite-transporting ATPase
MGEPGPRIILFAGKGGVGKTTASAATALACARSGRPTIALSLDVAHSLADALDLPRDLHDRNRGLPVRVTDHLDIQELDTQEELERHWGEVYKYFAAVFATTGLDGIAAREMAVVPGMDEVVALLYIAQYVRAGTYEVIVLDCAPTGESLRFLGMPQTIEWYMKKLFRFERGLVSAVRPLARRVSPVPLPDDAYFAAIERLFEGLAGVERVMGDPGITTVRLVTNPEKMVVRETQRAFMYLSLFNMAVDLVIVNRVLPEAEAPDRFAGARRSQRRYLEQIEASFAGTPVVQLPWLEDEVVGLDRLERVAALLYAGRDPAGRPPRERGPLVFAEVEGGYRLTIRLPSASREAVDLHRDGDELIIRAGSQKRIVSLPRPLLRTRVTRARFEGDNLVVTFEGGPA